ncbi:MAG: protein kinase [Gemmatimonadales bacterium]
MSTCAKCSRELGSGDVFCPACGTPNPEKTTGSADPGAAATAMVPQDDLSRRLQAAVGTDYVVEHMIGEGGFALVFAVTDRKLQRRIAVKVLRSEFTANKDSIRRFIREAESAAKLSHPHILPIFFVGEREGLVYFAMPLVDGETLDARLRREGQMPEAEVIRLGIEISDALAEAHGQGLVHRDVKPQNVMLSGAKKRALVMDFGIAKAAAGSGEKLTGTGVIIGSPHYMSPEQAGGEPTLDMRSDIYSLGIVLWEMLAGVVPFDGPSTQGILIQHLTSSVPNIRTRRPNVTAALSNVVAKATAKKVDDRFQNAHELSEALRQAGMGTGQRAMSWRVPRPLTLGLAAAVVLLASGGFLAWRHFAGAAGAEGHGAPATSAAKVAALPFESLGQADAAQFSRQAVRLLTDALDRNHVPTVDDEELLGHWTQDHRKTEDPLETKAAFAYEHGANQMLLGNAITTGRQIQLSVDVYDTHDLTKLGTGEATGSADSLLPLMNRVAVQIAGALCSQPGFNPQNRCYDTPARPVAALTVTDITKPGEVQPSPPTFLVHVDSAGGFVDARTRTPSSHDDVNAAALDLIRSARYVPARRHGASVSSWATVTVAVTSQAEAPQAAAASGCDEPGTNQGNMCFDTRPVPLKATAAPWRGAGTPTPPVLWVRVGADGAVKEVRVAAASSEPDFTETGKRVAASLTFSPAHKGGNPVAAWTQIAITKE